MSSKRDTQDAHQEYLPPLLVTSGDPAGIGPEVTHKAIKRLQRKHEVLGQRPLLVIGDAYLFARHLEKPSAMHTYHIVPAEDFLRDPGYIMGHCAPEAGHPWRPIFLDCGEKDEHHIAPGKQSRQAADRALIYLGVVLDMLNANLVDTVVTAPICKATAQKAGFGYSGQTELFAAVTGTRHPVMMLVGGGLRVALATIHVPVAKVPKLITRRLVRETIEITADALQRDFGLAHPRIAVCGLNPHAGEEGKIGGEERRTVRPAVLSAQAAGLDVTGPLAADTVFAMARKGKFDAVVAMYHDQGLIPVKTLGFDEGVNVTLGLPMVRTSPDHGTAFDIAGKHLADEGAMHHALLCAHDISVRRTGVALANRLHLQ